MPNSQPEPVARHYDTLFSPLETEEEPDWLQRATPEQRRRLQEHQKAGRQARAHAMQTFAMLMSLYDFAKTSLSTADRSTFTPATFLAVNQQLRLSVGLQGYTDRSYRRYLDAMLEPSTLRTAKQQAYLATLREEATIATIKGDLGKDGIAILKGILDDFESGSPELDQKTPAVDAMLTQISTLRLGTEVDLDQIIVFGPDLDDAPCIAYVPGHPRHPLKQYKKRTAFFASLRSDWQHPDFQAFMRRFIPLSWQQSVFANWRTPDRVLTLAMTCIPLDQGLRPYVSTQMVKRLLDDARYLLPENAAQVQALNDLDADFASMIEEHLMIGAGVGIRSGEEEQGLPPSDWIAPLHPVKLTNRVNMRWRADLSPYQWQLGSGDAGEPDAHGLYDIAGDKAIRINDAFYRVSKNAQGTWRIHMPRDTQAFSPPLYHNGAGAWHHCLEQPQHWERLALLRRLGPLTLDISDERLLLLARVAGVTNAQLRRVYLLDQAMPALLQYALVRERARNEAALAVDLLKHGKPLPPGYEAPIVKSFRRAASFEAKQAASLHEVINGHRGRRGTDEPTPPTEGHCDTRCNVPSTELFDRWQARLNLGIFEHRFELTQIAPDITVQALRRRFTDMPVLVAQQFLDENRQRIAQQLNLNLPLPEELAEQALESAEQGRLAQALDGFMQPASANQNTWVLAMRLLEFLPGWPTGIALVLRDGGRFGAALASLGTTDVETTSIYLDEEEGWFTEGNDHILAQDMSEYGFYRCILHTLNDAQRSQIGFGQNEPERLFQRLRELATARPLRAALLLDLPVRRHWLVAPAPEPAFRAPNALASDRLFDQEPIVQRLLRLITQAHPRNYALPSSEVEGFIQQLLRNNEPVSEQVQQLEDELILLNRTLDNWVAQASSNDSRRARRRATVELLIGWQARITQHAYSITLNDPALEELPPLPVQLPGINQLVIRNLPITQLPETLLSNLPNLQALDLSTLPLQGLPQTLGTLQRLRRLDLSQTRLTPTALSPLASLPRLEYLLLNDIDRTLSNWTAEQMAYITSVQTLRSLEIAGSSTEFGPGVFARLATLPALETLALNSNQITLTRQDIQDLANLTHLRRLNLSNNPLGLTPDVSRMLALEELDLSSSLTPLTQWPNGVEHLPRIHCIDLRRTLLSEVPVGAGALRGLRIHSAHISMPSYARFVMERQRAHLPIQPPDTESDSDSQTSSDDSEEHPITPEANWQTRAIALLAGMSASEHQQASELINGTHPSRVEFFSLLLRLSNSRQARDIGTTMQKRLHAVIRGALSTQLRQALYETAGEAVTCTDRDALVFSKLETLVEADQALQSHTDETATAALLALGTSHWRAHRLAEYVASNVTAWRQQGHGIEYSELELFFRIALAKRLGLRNQPVTQVYTGYTTWVTTAMLDAGEAAVLADQAHLLPGYLQAQPYWQRYLRYAHAPRLTVIHRWRERVGEYLDALGSADELPPTLSEREQGYLRQVLIDSGLLSPLETLRPDLRLNSAQVRDAYDALQRLVERAELDLTRDILLSQAHQDNSPQPGPSRRP
ncbi:NEL-type E3 ubiquitin ligase domain-containing protein [Pseudomonas rubra]|uniref:RING-type E3 ubiquitin transferase n=1 Tax=Pseudomonas rubra TaxID=2942627 RepID=A0ABT5P1K8_9PSED|nr:NEL-type E3 ubiquitin ligase domain-containing protein [Pseudomonas rubra]MDD1012158.1 hypothetical protein [Pseudomonas rubra]MDD1038406.1 hypothetical protein [Pseudomonas rubra]MDD1153443.1 hypothetical protein [Pseudomonas rubra]